MKQIDGQKIQPKMSKFCVKFEKKMLTFVNQMFVLKSHSIKKFKKLVTN